MEKACSSEAERTAHNGLVVGSIPAKLNFANLKAYSTKMKLSLGKYKTIKTKNYIKNNSLFFFFGGVTQNSSNRIQTEQEMKKAEVDYYTIPNRVSKNLLNQSIFKVSINLINTITLFIKPTNKKRLKSKQKLFDIEPLICLALKLNNKIYASAQLRRIIVFDYSENVLLLLQFLLTSNKVYLSK